jgi:hypothetical protein
MLNPTQAISTQVDEDVVVLVAVDEEHVSPDRSIIGPYSVDIPEPRD